MRRPSGIGISPFACGDTTEAITEERSGGNEAFFFLSFSFVVVVGRSALERSESGRRGKGGGGGITDQYVSHTIEGTRGCVGGKTLEGVEPNSSWPFPTPSPWRSCDLLFFSFWSVPQANDRQRVSIHRFGAPLRPLSFGASIFFFFGAVSSSSASSLRGRGDGGEEEGTRRCRPCGRRW